MDTWAKIKTWEMVMPPSRPDKWQLDIISELLVRNGTTCEVAVLGSTVEFRDLLFELGFQNITIFEKNSDYYLETFEYKVYRDVSEYVIWGDWLRTIRNLNRKFDVILSDLTSGNIPWHLRSKFYNYISGALKPDGLYVDRLLAKQIEWYDKKALIQKYVELPVNIKTVNQFNCEMLFCSNFVASSKTVDTTAIYDELLAFDIPKINLFVSKCYSITPRECKWWYGEDWEDEKKLYCKHFRILQQYDEPTDSAYYGRCKLFISGGV